jgi:hypothetical protein
MSTLKTHGLTPVPDPHRVELDAQQCESPDSISLATGTIAIVVDSPLVDNDSDSRDTR